MRPPAPLLALARAALAAARAEGPSDDAGDDDGSAIALCVGGGGAIVDWGGSSSVSAEEFCSGCEVGGRVAARHLRRVLESQCRVAARKFRRRARLRS